MWLWSAVKAFTWQSKNKISNLNEIEQESDLNCLLLIEEDTDKQTQSLQQEGKVTQLQEDFGLIDGEIYFLRSLKPKVSRGPLREGDVVKYRAKRKDENQQWKVVEILWASKNDENWMEEASSIRKHYMHPGDSVKTQSLKEDVYAEIEENEAESLQLAREVAKVISLTPDKIQVSIQTQDREEKLSFSLSTLTLSFALNIGDFLSLEIKLDGSTLDDLSNVTIVNAHPLRTRAEDRANVTSWWSTQRKGIINNNIFFDPAVCSPNYSPRANDTVEVLALECEPGDRNRKCNWRAYKVSPLWNRGRQPPLDIQSLIHQPTKQSIIHSLLENKNGIKMAHNHEFGTIMLLEENLMNIQISFDENRREGGQQFLNAVKFQYPDMKNIPVQLCEENLDKFPIELAELSFLNIGLKCSPNVSYGRTKLLCIFEFSQLQTKSRFDTIKFNIATYINFDVSDPRQAHIVNENGKNGLDFIKVGNCNGILNDSYDSCYGNKVKIIKGPRNGYKTNNGLKACKATFMGVGPGAVAPKRLAEYSLPSNLKTSHMYLDVNDLINMYPLLDEELSIYNYPEKWHCLLHVEESSLLHRMRQYEMSNVVLRDAGPQFLSLDVPGLAEKRPSLMLGDTAVVEPRAQLLGNSMNGSCQKYEGVIEEVRSHSVLMAFDDSFRRSYAGELVNVAFVLSRTNIKRMHVAAEHCFKQLGQKILFPEEVQLLPPQVQFITNDRDAENVCFDGRENVCYDGRENLEEFKSERIKLNVMNYKVFGGVSYSKLPPVIVDSELNETSKENMDSFNSTKSSGSHGDQFSSKSENSVSSILSSNSRISVAERLFKQATRDNSSIHFIMPKISLAPYSWVSNSIPSHSYKLGLKYEFELTSCLNELNPSNISNTKNMIPEASCVRHKENLVPAYIPKRMKNNKASDTGKPILDWVNKNLNKEQKSAVVRILAGEARPLPYIIYGPPGTGKPVTVVEAILQIFLLRFDSRILVTTPSNSSADLIVERLHNSKKIHFGDLARLNAMQRVEESIPELVRPYCFSNSDPEVLLKVVRNRIVVATCDTSGGIYKLGLTQGHFTHCIIDEAGETTEPKSLVPIGLLGLGQANEAQIILAGDPKQLGPVLQSSIAAECGLEESFLERLSKLKIYERDESRFRDHGNYDPVLCTKLIKNYRSHQDILCVSSKLFYDNELKPEAPDEIKNAMLDFEFLPNTQCPLIFHGVRGQNIQENDSPSWFNPAEALQVAKYLGLILNKGVTVEDVGIIAPYRKQTQKLRQLLASFDLPIPKVRKNKYY